MRSGSVEEFSANIDELSVKWSQPMVEYFNKDLKSDIERHAAKLIIEPLGLYDPYSGVTNNASESMNNLIKELGRWKEAPVDVLALCFYQLQNYFISEIRRGFAGIGNYRLKSDYLAIRCDPKIFVYRVMFAIQLKLWWGWNLRPNVPSRMERAVFMQQM